MAPKWGGVQEKCKVCEKSVYPMEKLSADGDVWHKTCFRCLECNKVLTVGNFAAIKGKLYCKPHFKQLFKEKGNYSESFGEEKLATYSGGGPASQTAAEVEKKNDAAAEPAAAAAAEAETPAASE